MCLLLCGAGAMAGEEVRIDLPGSDVVTGTKPFVVSIAFPEALATKGSLLAVELRRAEPGLAGSPVVASKVNLPGGACRVLVDGSALAEGLYGGTIEVAAGAARRSAEFTMFPMPDGRPREFPYGTYAVPFHFKSDPSTRKRVPVREQHKAVFRDMKAAGLNLICQHMNGMENLTWTMDRAAREGMWFMPSTNVLGHGIDANDDVLAVRSVGKPVDHWLRYCMYSPKCRRMSVRTCLPRLCRTSARGPSGPMPAGCSTWAKCTTTARPSPPTTLRPWCGTARPPKPATGGPRAS